MNFFFHLIIFLAFLSIKESARKRHFYEDDLIKCFYETCEGRVDGKYISFYKTGQKKSEGYFENNYRIGKWTVWDSTGRIRMQREYINPFTFKRIIPEIPKEATIDLLNSTRYNIQRNEDGYIEFFRLKERMVLSVKSVYRIATPINNPILFENNKLFNIINRNVILKNITTYDSKDESFRSEIVLHNDSSKFKIVGFKIFEDIIFDNERLVSECRINYLIPIAVNTLTQDTIELYLVRYPQLRKYLVQERINRRDIPEKIKNFDDLFFYRYYSGTIYKESNINDSPIVAYKIGKEIEKEAERIELSLIENEHDIWIKFTK